jgi:Methyltransferase domain
MLGAVMKILKNPGKAITAVTRDPLEAWIKLGEYVDLPREQRKPACRYEAENDWEHRLHDLLGVPWACEATSEFRALWPEVIEPLKATGVRVGPESFGCWNDGDPAFVRAIFCLIRHLQVRTVVETGVGHGVTSRFILEALERNGAGHLWSIDLPPNAELEKQVGIAAAGRCPDRWTYIKGSSRRRLPALLSELGQIDLFVHDSLHSERTVRFELDRAWAILRPGGALVVDDIDTNWGFHSFTQAFPSYPSLICEAEPLHPDLRRFNKKGLFGIILKEPIRRTEEASQEVPQSGCTH